MPSSREMDAGGLLICRFQADLFSSSLELPIGSADFIKRFIHSPLCYELDTMGIATKPMQPRAFIAEWKAKLKPTNGPRWSAEELHWVGYVYRYWAYVDGVPMKRLYSRFPPAQMRRFYPLYHGLDPAAAIDIWKKDWVKEDDMLYTLYRQVVKNQRLKNFKR